MAPRTSARQLTASRASIVDTGESRGATGEATLNQRAVDAIEATLAADECASRPALNSRPGVSPDASQVDAQKVQLAVFDFDGTSIAGDSPVMLVWHLFRHRMLKPQVIAMILMWAFAYKFRLPQSESWVRGLVFSAFEGWPASKVDAFLAEFYDERVAPRFRAEADAAMRDHADKGEVVVVVSATFEPILMRAKDQHPFEHQVSTRMKLLEDGTYSCQVEGKCVEGDQKIEALCRFANARYGAGAWELACAYGDHHSDRAILAAARQPFAVDPDRPLKRTAKRNGWPILHW